MEKQFKIDSHVHILPGYRLRGLIKWMHKIVPDHPMPVDLSGIDIITEMTENGITHFFNFVYPIVVAETDKLNQFNADFCRTIKGAIPFASLHPADENKPERAAMALDMTDFAGFKLHPFIQKFDPLDARMDAFYGFARERNKPVVFHTGFDDFYKARLPLATFEKIMKKYPGISLVLAHMGFPDIERAVSMLDDYPDLYLDTTLIPGFLSDDLKAFLPKSLTREKLETVLVEAVTRYKGRIFFGSDHPAGWGTHAGIFNDFDLIPLSIEEKQSVQCDAPVEFINKFSPDFDWDNHLQTHSHGLDEVKNS
jgi:hypothetical protein